MDGNGVETVVRDEYTPPHNTEQGGLGGGRWGEYIPKTLSKGVRRIQASIA